MSSRIPLPASVVDSPVIAIVRGSSAERVHEVCTTLLDNGVRHLEITTTTPGWEASVAALGNRPDAVIGVGTVISVAHVKAAAAVGARFVVAPNTNPEVGAAAFQLGLQWYPGALTPTEILAAWDFGASAVKTFPVSSVGGSDYLRQVRAPLPDIPLLPTGGIALDDIPAYLAAGAVAVGLGSPLLKNALAGGSLEALAQRARYAIERARRA